MKQILIGLMLSFLSLSSYAGVKVIVNATNGSNFDADTITKIFLGKKKSFSNGDRAIMLTLPDKNPTTGEFNTAVLGKDSSQLKSYWSKLVFTGKGTPPEQVESEAAMLDLVSKNPNIIGFVSSQADTSNVKVVGEY